MTRPETEQNVDFPINQQLLEDATRAMEEWRVMKDRLAKIEEHRPNVSEKVYERVRSDYEDRLAKATEGLLKKKAEIDRELATLCETRKKIEAQLEDHRHVLEEIKFRNTLGEFTEDEFGEKSNVEQEKISKFETILNAVDNNIHRYESIFEGEEELFAAQEGVSPEEEISEVAEDSDLGLTTAPHEAEPLTDEAGYVLDDGEADYFSPAASTPDTLHGKEESSTARAPIDRDAVEQTRPKSLRPRVVIINGDNAGAAFPLKGTISFGRAESNTIPLKDAKASRQHAQIQQQGNEYVLIDLNSSNGTYANGERVEEHVLSNGDEILIGDTLMQFQIDS